MPRLWRDTIEAHRREVRDTVLDTTADLAAERGPLNITMSQIAEAAGIGRATLYKYFTSVEQILQAWHERQVGHHLELVSEIVDRDEPPLQRLSAVLEAYADARRQRAAHGHRRHGPELVALLHHDHHVGTAEQQLHTLLRDLIAQAAQHGQVRSDVGAEELASFCRHAIEAAGGLRTAAATKRLVAVTLDGLRGP